MERGEYDYQRRNGSVKAAANTYGESVVDSPSWKKPQIDSPVSESSSRAIELHTARRSISGYKESRRAAESVKFRAESELYNARKAVKQLASMIEQSNTKAKSKLRNMEALNDSGRDEENALVVRKSIDGHEYGEVMKELEFVKQELSKLKLDMDSVLEEKLRAERDTESSSKRWSTSSVEVLRKEIEAVNEEQVLVELARMEALKEYGAIEALREKEAREFAFSMEEKKKKINEMIEEVDQSKELENKLAVTVYNVNALQNELKHVKEAENGVQRSDSLKHTKRILRRGEEPGSPLLRSITEELEAAKKELTSIKEEGFQFMTSMDIIRNELNHVTEETARLGKAEEKSELTVQNLNSKLLRAKSKLEAVSAAEEKANAIAINLSLTLQQLKTEAEAAKKEKELITEETAALKAEIEKTESEIDSTEEKLQSAMQELEAVKSSEASTLEKLKSLIESTMQDRASASEHTSTITISKFEYEYLTGRAVGAEEIADKKVAAAQAWIEALKASEKEILMKLEIAHKEIRETKVEEEKEVVRTERSPLAKGMIEGEIRSSRQKREKNTETENLQLALVKKPVKSIGNMTPARRAKFQKSASPANRMSRSTSVTIIKRKKAMPKLSTLFSAKKTEEDL